MTNHWLEKSEKDRQMEELLFEEISPDGKPVPLENFVDFYMSKKGQTVRELTETLEWKEVYSHYYHFNDNEKDIIIGETTHDTAGIDPSLWEEEFVKCATDFQYFCHRYVKILHPKHGTIPFILYQYQQRVIEEYEAHRFTIISKFRQGGLTTIGSLWGMWRCIFMKDQQIYVLSKTDREAKAAGDIVQRALENMPKWLYAEELTDFTKHEKVFHDMSSKICFYTPEAARGKSATLIIIDEAAFIPDMYEHFKSMYPVINTGGSVAVISTVNGMGNWYYDTYKEAEAGNNFFTVIDLDYWEHPEYCGPTWAKETKANMGDKGWSQEIMRSFLGSGETYIPQRIIAEIDQNTRNNPPIRTAFNKWTNKGSATKLDWEEGALWIWKEPLDGHEYILSADCAEGVGEGGDNSAFQVLDVGSLEQVAEFYSNTVPPHIFAQIINQTSIYYNTAIAVVENAGIGGAVLSNLQHDLSYENLYYEGNNFRLGKPGIKTGPSTRMSYLEAMQNRLMTGSVKINSCRFVHELNTFNFNAQKKRPEAEKGRHDDAIMSICFALFVRDSQMRGVPVGAEIPSELVDVFKTEVYEEIKSEILEGSPEDWIGENEEDKNDPLGVGRNDVLPGVSFTVKRKNAKLLREFGW